jgi:hypothetical protein
MRNINKDLHASFNNILSIFLLNIVLPVPQKSSSILRNNLRASATAEGGVDSVLLRNSAESHASGTGSRALRRPSCETQGQIGYRTGKMEG